MSALPVYEIDPFRYTIKCSIRGGVALLLKISIGKVQENEIDSPRVVGAEIQISEDQHLYCFVVYMPASSKPYGIFTNHVDLLELLYSVYSEKGDVIMTGDMNVKIRGPRYTFKDDIRTNYFNDFLQRSNLLLVNIQDSCKGPVSTFFPQTGHCTAIDHVLIECNKLDIVKSCCVLDDTVCNLSEHYPVICSLRIPIYNQMFSDS